LDNSLVIKQQQKQDQDSNTDDERRSTSSSSSSSSAAIIRIPYLKDNGHVEKSNKESIQLCNFGTQITSSQHNKELIADILQESIDIYNNFTANELTSN
jgi:hypothetical protein